MKYKMKKESAVLSSEDLPRWREKVLADSMIVSSAADYSELKIRVELVYMSMNEHAKPPKPGFWAVIVEDVFSGNRHITNGDCLGDSWDDIPEVEKEYFANLFGLEQENVLKPAIEMNIVEFLLSRTKRIVWMNVPILTTEGNFHYERVNPSEVMRKIQEVNECPFHTRPYDFLSAIRHEATATAFNAISKPFGIPAIEVNRIPYVYEEGDLCIIQKMRGRIAEGTILDLEEMNRVGYDFYAIWKI